MQSGFRGFACTGKSQHQGRPRHHSPACTQEMVIANFFKCPGQDVPLRNPRVKPIPLGACVSCHFLLEEERWSPRLQQSSAPASFTVGSTLLLRSLCIWDQEQEQSFFQLYLTQEQRKAFLSEVLWGKTEEVVFLPWRRAGSAGMAPQYSNT